MEIANKQTGVVNMGPIGGRAASANSGAFTAGNMIKGEGNYVAGLGTHKDLRGGDASAEVFTAGPTIMGKGGVASGIGMHRDLRGGGAPASTFGTGPMVTGKVK